MKRLFLIRHAKSDWSNSEHIQDIDRHLNTRGVMNSYEMAKRLKLAGVNPDTIVSSNGIRALHTAVIFARVLNKNAKTIEINDSLYHASSRTIIQTIQSLDDKKQSAFIFCHNPGINDFASTFIPDFYENVPTCGILAFELHSENWQNWNKEKVVFDFFDYPKKK